MIKAVEVSEFSRVEGWKVTFSRGVMTEDFTPVKTWCKENLDMGAWKELIISVLFQHEHDAILCYLKFS